MSGSGGLIGYVVEARVGVVSHEKPVRIQDGILTTEWRPVEFTKDFNPAGVPCHWENDMPGIGIKCDYLPYASAVALAWTLIAQQSYRGIEVRLAQYSLKYTYETKRDGVVDEPVGSFEVLMHRPKIIKEEQVKS